MPGSSWFSGIFRPPDAGTPPPLRFSTGLFAAYLFLAFFINYPGRLNEDSLEQIIGYEIQGQLGDLHSPLLTWLMGVPGELLGQPPGALLTQCLPLAFYAAVIPASIAGRRAGRIAMATEILFKMSLIVSAGYLIKDVFLAGIILSLASVFRLAASSSRPGLWLGPAIALAVVVLMVRATNFLMLGIAVALVLPFLVRSARSYFLVLASAAVLLALSMPLHAGFNRFVLGAHNSRAERQLIIFDAAGISTATNTNQFASLPGWPTAQLPPPSHCHTPKQWGNFAYWGRCNGYTLAFNDYLNRSGRQAAASWWLRTVASNPSAYLTHRLAFTRELLVSEADEGWRHHLHGINTAERIHVFRRSAAGRMDERAVLWWRENAVAVGLAAFSSAIYQHRWTELTALVLCVILLGWSWLRRRRGLPLDLAVPIAAAFGIANFAVFIPFGIASWSRYLWPTVCCAGMALIAALYSAEGARAKAE